MPTEMSSWADEIEDTDSSLILPPPSEKYVDNQKITTEYFHDDDGKKFKIIRTFKIEKKLVSKAVARRKALPKFGMSKNDRPGPDSATTVVCEEVLMNFTFNKEEFEKDTNNASALQRFAEEKGGSIFKCRICREDHMTAKCPYKDTHGALRESLLGIDKGSEGMLSESSNPEVGKINSGKSVTLGTEQGTVGQSNKYVPPSMRGNEAGRMGAAMPDKRGRDADQWALRVSNLSENTQEVDLQDLFDPFGTLSRIFLARDKYPEKGTQAKCKGYAFINYHKKDDAAKAIATLHGFGYDHLILNVEWAKPSGT